MAIGPEKLLRYLRAHVGSTSACGDADAVLLSRFVEERTQDAFAELIRRHGPMVLRLCRRVLGDVQLAEDAFQATFLVLARKAGTIRRRNSLAAWLHGVAMHVAAKARTSAAKHRVLQQVTERADPAGDPLSQLTAREFLTVLDEEVQRLPDNYRLPLILCCLEGMGLKETAQRLGWTEGTVKGRLERGRNRLHERLLRRGLALPVVLAGIDIARGSLWARLSHQLLYRTAEEAIAFVGQQSATATTISAEVLRLAQTVLRGTIILRLKIGLALVFLAGVATLGASGLSPWADSKRGKLDEPNLAFMAPAQPKPNADLPRVDQHGDPLPEGAVARLGPLRFRYEGYPGRMIFTRDGKTLLAYTHSGVHLWDAATGKEIRRLATRVSAFETDMDVAADGTTLAIGNGADDEETKISLWDLRSGKNTGAISLPNGEGRNFIMYRIRIAPDGKSLAAMGWPQSDARFSKAFVFDIASGKVRSSLGGGANYSNLAYAPDGKVLAIAAGAKSGIQLWDTASMKLIRTIDYRRADMGKLGYGASSLVFSPDGKTLAVASLHVLLFDVATGQEVRRLALPKFAVQNTGLAFTPEGNKLICNDMSGQVVVWEVITGKVLQAMQHHRGLSAMALSPGGKTVAVGNDANRTVRLWDVATGKELFTEYKGQDPGTGGMALAPDGKTLVTVAESGENVLMTLDGKALHEAESGQFGFWDTASWRRSRTLPVKGRAPSFSPDGKKLAAIAANSSTYTSKVRIWDSASGNETLTINVPGATDVEAAVFSLDGQKLCTLDRDDRLNCFHLRQWDVATGKQDRLWKIPLNSYWNDLGQGAYGGHVIPASVALDRKTVFAGAGNHLPRVEVFDAESGRKRSVAIKGEGEIRFVPSPDARVVASWIFNGYWVTKPSSPVCLSEVLTGKEILVLRDTSKSVAAAAWSLDGRLLATGDERFDSRLASMEQTVRLWDTATAKELARFTGFKADVSSLTFAPDGRRLFTALSNGTILIWDTAHAARTVTRKQSLTEAELQSCWTALAGGDAGMAYQAIWKLIAAPKDSVPFLRSRVKPAVVADGARVQRWIANLGSEQFAVRQGAARELRNVGEQVKAPIETVMQGNLSLETRRRLESVLDNLSSAVPGPATVRTLRAVMVLERIASPEAKGVLEALARGAPGARETEEARASLQRLVQRTQNVP